MTSIQTILHPTDFSDSARPALSLARRLAREHGARLIVLHVMNPTVLYGELGMTIPLPEMQNALRDELRAQLEAIVGEDGADCRIAEGLAAAEILRTARETSCDLIVLGTHGRGGVARVLLGSVAVEVLRQAPCPVLAVKTRGDQKGPAQGEANTEPGAATRPSFPVILHPTDYSERSRHAFDLACTLARGGGRVIVLHVVEEVHVASEGYEDALHERLRKFRSDDPTIQVEYRLREGDSSEEILGEASASSCDLIAMGTHGRSGFNRLRLGSVAEAVLRRADCPVLTVKDHVRTPVPVAPVPGSSTFSESGRHDRNG